MKPLLYNYSFVFLATGVLCSLAGCGTIVTPFSGSATTTSGAEKPATALPAVSSSVAAFFMPIDRAKERVTKKFFGIFVSPQNSPVQPERFRGYHTGVDFEIFSGEQDASVSINAICSGTILRKGSVSGYGGMLVQFCEFQGEPITVVYGHLNLASILTKLGDQLKVEEHIGILGEGNSSETDGERKHLHLGIHKGKAMNIRGYASTKSELNEWLDFGEFLK